MPLLWLSLAFLGGLLLGAALPAVWPLPAALAGGLLGAAFFERRLPRFALPQGSSHFSWYQPWRDLSHLPLAAVLAAACLGVARYQSAQSTPTENDLAWYNGRGEYRLEGIVTQPPMVSDNTVSLLVAVDLLVPLSGDLPQGQPHALRAPAGEPVQGLARVYLPLGRDWRYGDRVQLWGEPEEPFMEGASFFHDALARQGIHTLLSFPGARLVARGQGNWFWSALYDFRALADRTLARLLPQPQSALLAGILLGDDRALPKNVSEAFRATGISHIIAVSGFNIAIISGLFIKLLGRLLRARFAIPLAVLAVAGYALLTGASPSVVRAAVMGGIGMLGPLLGRRQVGVNSLAFTAAVMGLFTPTLPWDLSFQLSFGATLGLVLFADPLQGLFVRIAERWLPSPVARRLSGPAGEFFLFSLAAQIFTLPITAVNFQQVSLSSLLANPLVLPVQPYAMILGGLALLLGLVFLPLGQLLAWLCWPLLTFTIYVAEGLARLQNSVLNVGGLSAPLVILYYAGLVALPALRALEGVPALRALVRRAQQALRAAILGAPAGVVPLQAVFKPALVLGLTGLLAAGLWRAALSAPDGRLHLDVLNLPGGPALLVRSPGGQAWLVDGGSESSALADALGRRLPLFTTRLDGLLVTAGRPAVVLTALDSLTQKYSPTVCALSAGLNQTAALDRITERLLQVGVRSSLLDDTPSFDLGGGAALRVLADGEKGTALWLAAGGFNALVPGDVPPGQFAGQAPAGLSLLILSQDDLENMAPAVWAAAFQPQAVLFTGGAPPLPGWIGLDSYDWVSFLSDGSRYWIEGQAR